MRESGLGYTSESYTLILYIEDIEASFLKPRSLDRQTGEA